MGTPRQTNLYNPAFRAPRDWVSLSRLALAAGLLALATAAAGTWMSWELRERETRVSALTAQTQTLQATLEVLKPAQAARDRRAADELAGLVAREQVLRRILEAAGELATGPRVADSGRGHSQLLEALARASQPGLWLTEITISADARSMTLKGRMIDAGALPPYIARLNAEPLLAGLRFDQLDVKVEPLPGAAPGGPAPLAFVLQAAPAAPLREAAP